MPRTVSWSATAQRGFDAADPFAVALCGVSVANLEQRAWREHRDEERGAGDEFLVIEIAGVPAGRVAAHAAKVAGRRDTHAAEKRLQRNDDPRHELRRHGLSVEGDDFCRTPRYSSPARSRCSRCSRSRSADDRQDLHFERVARLGAFDIDGTGEDVAARSAFVAGHLGDDRLQRRLNPVRRHTGILETGR